MKKLIILIFALIMAVALAACGGSQEPEEPADPPAVEEPAEEPEELAEEPDEPEEKTADVTLYFANNDYVETGDEQYEFMLTETRTVTYDDEICLEEAVVRALMEGPDDEENLSTGFPDSVQLIGVSVLDGTAYVNFSSEGLGGGSMQESYVISQTVQSLGELGSVQRVQFLVDDQEAESLMGHISIEEPIEVTME